MSVCFVAASHTFTVRAVCNLLMIALWTKSNFWTMRLSSPVWFLSSVILSSLLIVKDCLRIKMQIAVNKDKDSFLSQISHCVKLLANLKTCKTCVAMAPFNQSNQKWFNLRQMVLVSHLFQVSSIALVNLSHCNVVFGSHCKPTLRKKRKLEVNVIESLSINSLAFWHLHWNAPHFSWKPKCVSFVVLCRS